MKKLKIEPGVVTGDALGELFDYCHQSECALPAVNVIGSHSVNAVLAAAREAVSPVIIQFSNGGLTSSAIKKYMDEADGYLHSQIGNPEGDDQPNKKHIDPRKWLHLGERGMAARVVQAFGDLGSRDKFDF